MAAKTNLMEKRWMPPFMLGDFSAPINYARYPQTNTHAVGLNMWWIMSKVINC